MFETSIGLGVEGMDPQEKFQGNWKCNFLISTNVEHALIAIIVILKEGQSTHGNGTIIEYLAT